MSDQFKVLLTLAMRNLFTRKVGKSIVGAIIFFGTVLVVMGTAVLDSIEEAMARSVTSSLAGHLQLYSADSRDELALFGAGFFGGDDFGEIDDFGKLREAAESLDGVQAAVPMGLQIVTVASSNEIDDAIEELRKAVDGEPGSDFQVTAEQIRQIAADIRTEMENRLRIAADTDKVQQSMADLDRVASDEFWQELKNSPQEPLLFLDTRIAPLAMDGQLIYLRNVGTDLERFTELFDRFQIVDGEPVPPGKRGFLFAKRVYERQVKNKVARVFDRIKRDRENDGLTIAEDPVLRDQAKRLPDQYRRVTFQLSPEDAEALRADLGKLFPQEKSEDLVALVKKFLVIDDDNFQTRYDQFYEFVAPRIRLYKVKIGDTLTLRAFTRAGYIKSLNVRVYGTYQFEGLEASDLAGAQNLLDIVSFRELYGVMNDETRAELRSIRDTVGVEDVGRGEAEDALFGGSADVESDLGDVDGPDAGFDEFAEVDLAESVEEARGLADEELPTNAADNGLAVNVAVLLEDPSDLDAAKAELANHMQAEGFDVKIVDWQEASGMVGQFITVVRLVLYIAIVVIFLVALVIINNSMVMATLERTSEIGTMRAIGAQRGFVQWMFILETVVLGLIAGTAGVIAGAGAVMFLGNYGIPAGSNVLVFLFSGPRLYPDVETVHLVTGFVSIIVVSVISTIYPAHIATRIQPVVAMQSEE